MKQNNRSHVLLTALLALLVLPLAALAQETTSAIRGKILDNQGNPVAAANVSIIDTRTEITRQVATNSGGTFLVTNLPVGGPYKVTVDGTKSVTVDSIQLGEIYNLTVNLQSVATMEEVVVVGESAALVNVAAGPAANFTTYDIESAVAYDRDIVDVYSFDPRLNVDNEDDSFAVNCAGQHPRFNNITLDGVSYSDRFGLNENGYSTATGMPFPFDGIQQITVELAPFDVTYGGFSACNINSVTRSGSNEWHGNAFYDYTSDSLRGDSLGRYPDRDFSTPSYEQERQGFSIGGPIIKDRLFVYAAYEESERPRFIAQGYAGSNNGEERPWLDQATFERVQSIAQNLYGYDPGGLPQDGAQEDEKYMVRLDWNINDRHTLSGIYNYYDGFQDRDSDGDSNEFEYANHFYTKGAESTTTTLRLSSLWTDQLSTEIFWSQNEMNDSQVTVGPRDFGDFQISDFDGNTIYLGADDSRQANALGTESEYFKLIGQYLAGNHLITAGYERETVDIFNIFVPHSRGGEWDFYGINRSGDDAADCASLTAAERYARNDCDVSGIDQFELGRPHRVYYGSGGGTNNANDAAAMFGNSLNTVYVQDEIFFDDHALTIVAGLRYDWFTSSDRPVYNEAFSSLFGIRNDANIDGVDLLMPRLGFTWEATPDVTVRGGLGLFSGGNPNVWISNAWSNDGLTNAQYTYRNDRAGFATVFGEVPLTGTRPGYDIPQEAFDYVAGITPQDGGTGFLVLIDPDYEQPSAWKFAIGAHWESPFWGIGVDVDYMHSRQQDPAMYVDLSQEIVGTTAAGSPIYDYVHGSSAIDNFMLTNSSREGETDIFSVILYKDFDFGLDVSLGYAYTDSTDVSPMTSAVAASNWENVATLDINDPLPATSDYVVPHRFTLRARYQHAFFRDYLTRFTLSGYSQEGQPGTYVMFSGDLEGDGFFGRHLLYVPTGANDPNVVFGSGFDQEAFWNFVANEGMGPGFQERNNWQADWTTLFNLRVDQEFPIWGDVRGRAFMLVYNLGNLLNDDWGEVWDGQFFSQEVVQGGLDSEGRFVYERFLDRDVSFLRESRSLYEIRFGIEIDF